MRRLLLGLIFMFAGALGVFGADPGAELDNFDDGDNYTKQGLYYIMRGKPIIYAYEVATRKQEGEAPQRILHTELKKEIAQFNYEQIITNNLKAWPLQAAEWIKNAGREEEFADVLDLFSGVEVIKADVRTEASVFFVFSDMAYIHMLPGSMGACGLTSDFAYPVEIYILDPNLNISGKEDACYVMGKNAYEVSDRVALHEVGHYYALAEQYDTSNASVLYSDSDRINRQSIMGASYSTELNCDDVDAFIKLADRTYYKINGKHNERDSRGWESFCKDGTVYQYGKVLNRKPYYSKWKIYKYDAQGNIAGVINKLPYLFSPTDTVIHDPDTGLITKSIDVENNVYTTYTYHFTEKSKAVNVSLHSLKDNKEKLSTRYERFNKNNFWMLEKTLLFVTPEKCRFVYNGNATADAFFDRRKKTLEMYFTWGGHGENYLRVKKYDFTDNNYKCEYLLAEDDNGTLGKTLRRYVLQYRGDEEKFVLLEGKLNKTFNKEKWEYIQKVCSDKISAFPELDKDGFASACAFFSAVDES